MRKYQQNSKEIFITGRTSGVYLFLGINELFTTHLVIHLIKILGIALRGGG